MTQRSRGRDPGSCHRAASLHGGVSVAAPTGVDAYAVAVRPRPRVWLRLAAAGALGRGCHAMLSTTPGGPGRHAPSGRQGRPPRAADRLAHLQRTAPAWSQHAAGLLQAPDCGNRSGRSRDMDFPRRAGGSKAQWRWYSRACWSSPGRSPASMRSSRSMIWSSRLATSSSACCSTK